MTTVLIVGLGDLGKTVAKLATAACWQVIGVKRSPAEIAGVTVINADVSKVEALAPLETLQPNIVLYCVSADGQTDVQYQTQYVDGLRNVLNTQQHNPHLKHVAFVSSTRVYGQQTDQLLDEQDLAMPADFGGERLLQAEQLLADFATAKHCESTVFRLSGIYGPGRLRMIRLAKTPADWPLENSWTNRIHRDDAAAFIHYALQKVQQGQALAPCYIITDSAPVSQYEVLGWVAEQLQSAKPADFNKKITHVHGGKRLSNAALLATGFQLQYPDYRAGYQALLTSQVSE